jgi:hypothetical protein
MPYLRVNNNNNIMFIYIYCKLDFILLSYTDENLQNIVIINKTDKQI